MYITYNKLKNMASVNGQELLFFYTEKEFQSWLQINRAVSSGEGWAVQQWENETALSCDTCHNMLTKDELSTYDQDWIYAGGEMLCLKHRRR